MAAAETSADGVVEILCNPGVGLVAIDLRGTLIRTPRVTALLPELDLCGVPSTRARTVQARFDEQLRGPLQQRGDILDWTRFAAATMASMLAPAQRPALDVEAVVAAFEARYLRQSHQLIEQMQLRQAARALKGRCVIVADGPRQREAAVLSTCFGTHAWMPPLVSAECLGVNKLTSKFFARLSRRWGVAPQSTVVVGDRWDKDVLIPRRAGCQGVLVGRAPSGAAAVDSLGDLVGLLSGSEQTCPT